jgi:hypothetical protein
VKLLAAWLRFDVNAGPRTRPEEVDPKAQQRAEAEKRSQDLLRSWLSPEQLAQYDMFGFFEAVGSDTGKRYRICRGRIFNIQELGADGREEYAWCFRPEGVATGDVNLAQKIALENFETKALRIANQSSASIWQSVERPSQPRSWMRAGKSSAVR